MFNTQRTATLWPMSEQAPAEATLQKVFRLCKCELGGKWGMSNQEWTEQFARCLRTMTLGSPAAAGAQAILESGWGRFNVLFGIKSRAADLLGPTDTLFGIPSFHPEAGSNSATGTKEFDAKGKEYSTTASFITGSMKDQFDAYEDLLRRVHPLSLNMKDPWMFLHYICRPGENFRKAYSTAPWIIPGTKTPIAAAAAWDWNQAWDQVRAGKAVSLYAQTAKSVIDSVGLEVFR